MTGKIGTPLYMAPELMSDEEHFGFGVDVYAFAFIAYEIMTCEEPFSHKGKKISSMKLFKKVMNGKRPKINNYVTDEMKDLICRCVCVSGYLGLVCLCILEQEPWSSARAVGPLNHSVICPAAELILLKVAYGYSGAYSLLINLR